MVKNILFDWDGCLANTLPVWFNAMEAGFAYFDLAPAESVIYSGFQTWDHFPDHGITDIKQFSDVTLSFIQRQLENIELNDGALELLAHIKELGLTASIVTSTERDNLMPVLDKYNIESYFSTIICREDVDHLKPDAEPILKTLTTLNGNKEDAIIIGDSSVDIKAGKNAGISTAWYTPDWNQRFHDYESIRKLNPDLTISDLKTFQDAISLNLQYV